HVRDGLFSPALGELGVVQAGGLDKLVHRAPVAVADELAPAADGPVLGRGGLTTADNRGRALPQYAVGCRPADAVALVLAVGELEPSAVDGAVMVRAPRAPALDGAAEVVGRGRRTVDERVRPRRQVADSEIVSPLLRLATLEKRLLPVRVIGVPPIAADLRNGVQGGAILDGDRPARLPDGYGRSGEVCRWHRR